MAGLYRKYHITKTDGSPVDPSADYFVLRLDAGEYVDACRVAMVTFAEQVESRNPTLAYEIATLLATYGHAGALPPMPWRQTAEEFIRGGRTLEEIEDALYGPRLRVSRLVDTPESYDIDRNESGRIIQHETPLEYDEEAGE